MSRSPAHPSSCVDDLHRAHDADHSDVIFLAKGCAAAAMSAADLSCSINAPVRANPKSSLFSFCASTTPSVITVSRSPRGRWMRSRWNSGFAPCPAAGSADRNLGSIQVGRKWPAFATVVSHSMQHAAPTSDESADCPYSTSFRRASICAGWRDCSLRSAPTIVLTVIAAFNPLPLTSPTTMSSDPSSPGWIWKKSPPTLLAEDRHSSPQTRGAGCGQWNQQRLHLARLLHLELPLFLVRAGNAESAAAAAP